VFCLTDLSVTHATSTPPAPHPHTQVEHFSRYGVPMDEEGDDEDQDGDEGAGAAADEGGVGGGGGGAVKGRRLGAASLTGDSDLDEGTVDEGGAGGGGGGDSSMLMMEDEGVEVEGGDGLTTTTMMMADEPGAPGFGPGGAAEAAAQRPSARKRGTYGRAPRAEGGGAGWGSRWDDGGGEGDETGQGEPLQHTLPALLSLQPGHLAAMRDSFFRQGGAAAADAVSAEAALAVVLPGQQQQTLDGAAAQRRAAAAQRTGATANAAHDWARPRPALLLAAADSHGSERSAQHGSVALVAGPSSPSRLRAVAARSAPLVPAPADRAAGNVCDAFMLMGRSFRASFGPGGQLAYPVNPSTAVGAPAPAIAVVRVLPMAGVKAADSAPLPVEAASKAIAAGHSGPAVAALRRRTLAALDAHLGMSRQSGDEDERQAESEHAPSWQLVCSRRQLPRLVEQQVAALGSRRSDNADARHSVELWQLVQVLFEHIEGDEVEGDEEGGAGDGGSCVDDMSVAGDDAAGSVLGGGERSKTRLAAFKRRAAMSHWLAVKSGRAVREAVAAASATGGRDALPWALLHLVAGHQLGPAAALAAAAGDTRLAVLLSTAGRHSAITADLGKQLQVWHTAGLWRDHFSQPRKLLMAILSGRMGEAAAALRLDWPRALGLALW